MRPIVVFAWAFLAATPSAAATLSVSPVTLDVVTRGEAATSVTVFNRGDDAVNVQARVMKWSVQGGRERLEATDAVVVSPPIASVAPGQQQFVRIVRVDKAPVTGEESYRVLIDELPAAPQGRAASVSLVVRQSLPVFFRTPKAGIAPLSFDLKRDNRKVVLSSENAGDLHFKITALTVKDRNGAVLFGKRGLMGYVLGHSSYVWPLPPMRPGVKLIEADTEHGVVSASLDLK